MILLLILVELLLLFLSSRQLQGMMSGLFLHITKKQKPAIWLMALTFLPGTFIHELSHYLVARIVLVKASVPHLWPRLESDRIVMGHVMVPKVDPVRMFLIGIAPFIVGLTCLGLLFYAGYTFQWWTLPWYWQGLIGFSIFQISNSLFLSGADLKQMTKLMVITLAILAILYVLGVRPSLNQVPNLIQQHQQLLQLAAMVMAIPIALNITLMMLFAILGKVLRK